MTRNDAAVCFIVPRIAGGGVLSRITKWTRALESLGQPCAVAIVDDVSSRYYRKALPELFSHTNVQELTFDSCDKGTTTAARLSAVGDLKASRAIVVSKFPVMHAVARHLRSSGWKGLHVEDVPSDDEMAYRVNRENLEACDMAVGVSTEIAERLRGMFPAKVVEVCPGGAEVQPLLPGERDRSIHPLRVCYVGRLDPVQRRVFDLPEIAREARMRGAECEWTMIGGGEAEQELKTRFAAAGVDAARFPGKLPHVDVRSVLRQQHVFVLPSAFGGQSNAMCEAMEAGVVPVATNVSGSRDAVDDGVDGFLVEVGGTSLMAQRIEELSRDAELRQRMSRAARAKAERSLSTRSSVERLLSGIGKAESSTRPILAGRAAVWMGGRGRLLESGWIPNVATRMARKAWRAVKGRPGDLGR